MVSTIDSRVELTPSFQSLLDGINKAFSRKDQRVDVDELWRVLENYKSNPKDWSRFAYYDNYKYKRNLVDETEKYNVMIICWGYGSKSCIHDHSGSHCFMKLLEGELIESRFAWPENNQEGNEVREMEHIYEASTGINDVMYINDKVGLHRVENPSDTKLAVSLHVYIPPYRKCKAFDQKTGLAQDCKLTFFSKCGKVVKEEESLC